MSAVPVTRAPMARAGRQLAAALLWLACAVPVAAQQALPDPTRPPPEASMLPGAPMALPYAGGPRLQSVLVSSKPGGRRVAVIDGQTVRLGGKFDGAVLVKVTDTEVVLRRGKALQVLTLFPKPDLGGFPSATLAPMAAVSAPAPAPIPAAAAPAATTSQRPPVSNQRSKQ